MIVRRQKVTIHFSSGRKLSLWAHSVTKTFSGNELTGLEGLHTLGWPFYFRLDAVEAVTIAPGWRWGLK